MAGQEARQLIGFGDSDEDGRLTLQEILENSEFYTGSKLYNYAQSVHEEFWLFFRDLAKFLEFSGVRFQYGTTLLLAFLVIGVLLNAGNF